MAMRNNVTRYLEARKVPFTIHQLPGSRKLSAQEVARELGLAPGAVFKTLVTSRTRPGKPVLALVAAPADLDLKALAAALGEKKVVMTTQREAEEITGLQAGGISALALLHRPFDVVLDSSALNYSEIYISGGQRGLSIGLAPAAFIALTDAKTAAIRKE